MDEETQVANVTDLYEGEVEAGGRSLKDRLAQRREDILANRFKDIDLPGYDGMVYGRYRLLDGTKLNNIAENVIRTIKQEQKAERGLAAAIDTLAAALIEVRVRDDGRDMSLAEHLGEDEGAVVRFDVKLADFMGFKDQLSETPRVRDIVKEVFLNNEVAIMAHNQQLSRWMMTNGVDVETELMQDFG